MGRNALNIRLVWREGWFIRHHNVFISVMKELKTRKYNMSQSTTKPTKWHVRPANTQIILGIRLVWSVFAVCGERGGSVVECRTPEREVRGSRPTAAVLCPWARHFTPRKYWLITQEAMAPSRHDWKIVDWDVKPQHNTTVFAVRFLNS